MRLEQRQLLAAVHPVERVPQGYLGVSSRIRRGTCSKLAQNSSTSDRQ